MGDNKTKTCRRMDPLKTALPALLPGLLPAAGNLARIPLLRGAALLRGGAALLRGVQGWVLLAMLQAVSYPSARAQSFQLSSPAGKVTVLVGLKEKRTPYPKGIRPYYQIRFKQETVVRDSWLGLKLKGGPPLERDFALLGWDRSTVKERYSLPYGTRRELQDSYRQGILRLQETGPSRRRLDLVFRAYDEGAAFRYRIPRQPRLPVLELMEEASTFFFPEGCKAWPQQLRGYRHQL